MSSLRTLDVPGRERHLKVRVDEQTFKDLKKWLIDNGETVQSFFIKRIRKDLSATHKKS